MTTSLMCKPKDKILSEKEVAIGIIITRCMYCGDEYTCHMLSNSLAGCGKCKRSYKN